MSIPGCGVGSDASGGVGVSRNTLDSVATVGLDTIGTESLGEIIELAQLAESAFEFSHSEVFQYRPGRFSSYEILLTR